MSTHRTKNNDCDPSGHGVADYSESADGYANLRPEESSSGDESFQYFPYTRVSPDLVNTPNGHLEQQDRVLARRRRVWTMVCLSSVHVALGACFGILAPFFPQAAARKGTSSTVVGFIFGVFQLVVFVTSPIVGSLLSRVGVKFMLVAGIFIGGTSITLFGLLDMSPNGTVYIAMCFVCRSFEAVGCAMTNTASLAIVASEFPDHVATYVGFLETALGIGMMASPALGGVLYDFGGFQLPFFVVGGVMFSCTLLTVVFLPSDGPKQKFSGSMTKLIRIPSILIICAVVTASSAALGFLEPTLAAHLDKVNMVPLSYSVKGAIFLICPGVYGLSAPVFGILNDKFNIAKPMMVIGCFLMSASFFLVGPSPVVNIPSTLWLVIVSLVPYGLGVSMAILPTFQQCLRRARVNGFEDNLNTYGLVSGLFNSSFSFGAFAGPTLAGYLIQIYSFKWATTYWSFAIGAMGFMIMAFFGVFSVYSRRHTERSLLQDLGNEITVTS